MRPTDLVKSTPLRLALLFSSLFFATFFVAGMIAYQVILGDLKDRLDQAIAETSVLISATYNSGELEDFTHAIDSYVASTPDHERVFLALDHAGLRLAGNLDPFEAGPGMTTLSASALGLDGASSYRVLKSQLDGVQLFVGASLADTDEFSALTMKSFAMAGIIAGLVSILLGLVLAGLAQRRMAAIADTMRLVGRGDLGARIAVGSHRDDVGLLSGQINVALDRLASLVEGMRQVSVDIAHDLKTPLNRMSMTIEHCIDLAERGAPNIHQLLQAQIAASQINSTFEALLRIAQLEAGDRRERFRPLSLVELVTSVVDIYEDVAEDSGKRLKLIQLEPEPMAIVGDPDLLTQLLANLIENSIRHAAGGSSIDVTVARVPAGYSVAVADDGPGIPVGERTRVFQRLYRLEKSRTTPGSGLGLSMVKAIADLHGASIELWDRKPGLVVELTFSPFRG